LFPLAIRVGCGSRSISSASDLDQSRWKFERLPDHLRAERVKSVAG